MSAGARRRAGRRTATSRAAVLVFRAAFVLSLAGPAGRSADAAVGISLDPARQEFSLAPGGSRRYRFRVANPDDRREVSLTFRVVDIDCAPDGSIDIPEGPVPAWSAADWISLSRTEVRMRPGARAVVPYSIRVPLTARGGGYAAILAETVVPARGRTGGSIRVGLRIPYVILVSVRGTELPGARLLAIRRGDTAAGDARPYFVELLNSGNVLLRPRGDVIVDTPAGSFTGPINPRALALLPGTRRTFEVPVVEPAGADRRIRTVIDHDAGPAGGAAPSSP